MRFTIILLLAIAGTAAAADAVTVKTTDTELADQAAITAAADAEVRRQLDARYGRLLRAIEVEIAEIRSLVHADESAYPDAIYLGAIKALREAEHSIAASHAAAIGRSAGVALDMAMRVEPTATAAKP